MENIIDNSVKAKKRLLFIDIMRGLAVIWMIEAHITHAVMQTTLKNNFLWNLIAISNGFVAVTFLFCAGAGFWLAANKKFSDYKSFGKPLYGHLKKIGLVLFAGYWLHLPFLSFRKFLTMPYADWLKFYETDILQNIAVSSLLAIILLLVLPKLKHLSYLSIYITILIFFLAPIIWVANLNSMMHPFFGAYFAIPPISKFPLFHWSGYFFAGIFFTDFFMNFQNKEKLAKILIASSIISITLLLITNQYQPLYGWKIWWDSYPGHNFFRLSGAVLIFASLYLAEKYIPPKISKVMSVAGQESLFVYVFHLMIVYGSVVNIGLSRIIGPTQNGWATTGLFILVTAVSLTSSFYWNKLKITKPKLSKIIFNTLLIGFLVMFAIKPY